MRPLLIILVISLLGTLGGCASDGAGAKPEATDPLMAMYHGSMSASLASKNPTPESSNEGQPGNAHDEQEQASSPDPQQSEDKGGIKANENAPSQNEGNLQPTELMPALDLGPRHQALMYETPLSDQSAQRPPEHEQVTNNQPAQGDPMLGTYHRQLTAAPLSDDLALNGSDTDEPQGTSQKPVIALHLAQPQSESETKTSEIDQPKLNASLHLQPLDKTPVLVIKPTEKAENEPTLVNPPEQTRQIQIWIEQVDLIEAEGQIIVDIQLSGKTSPNIYILDEDGDSPKLILDFPGVIGRGFPHRIDAPPSIATAIRMANHPKKARVVVDLVPRRNYEVQPAWIKGQNKLLVSVSLI